MVSCTLPRKKALLQIFVTILRIDLLHVGSTFLVEIEWILIFTDLLFSKKKMVATKKGGTWKNINKNHLQQHVLIDVDNFVNEPSEAQEELYGKRVNMRQ